MATIAELIEYKLSNREKKLSSKKGKFWCMGCDRYLVYEWEKCPICGKRNGIRRLKKDPPLP